MLVATGVRDELPAVPGVAEQWGKSVVVCPYCDDWESRDRRIGILATGSKSIEQAHLLRQWSAHVVFLVDDAVLLDRKDRAEFTARGISIVDSEVREVTSEHGQVHVALVDGGVLEVDRILTTAPTVIPNDKVLRMLGAATRTQPAGDFVQVGTWGATSVDGIWAAGNVVNPSLKVPTAVGNGMAAGADINEALVRRDLAAAVAHTTTHAPPR